MIRMNLIHRPERRITCNPDSVTRVDQVCGDSQSHPSGRSVCLDLPGDPLATIIRHSQDDNGMGIPPIHLCDFALKLDDAFGIESAEEAVMTERR